MIHEGQLLRDLVKKLKAENGMSRSDVAQKIGITPEHLSTVFNLDRLTAEIKTGAIEGPNLPPDFFKGQPSEAEPPTDWQAEAARLDAELRSIKDRYAVRRLP